MIAAMLASLTNESIVPNTFVIRRKDAGPPLPFGGGGDPINTGRRAEKDAVALAKAEAKRQRKAAKILKSMTPNAQAVGAASAAPTRAQS